MKHPYTKPRIIPRTERLLWPHEVRILDERMTGGFSVAALRRFNGLFPRGSRRGLPTADEQDLAMSRRMWARRFERKGGGR